MLGRRLILKSRGKYLHSSLADSQCVARSKSFNCPQRRGSKSIKAESACFGWLPRSLQSLDPFLLFWGAEWAFSLTPGHRTSAFRVWHISERAHSFSHRYTGPAPAWPLASTTSLRVQGVEGVRGARDSRKLSESSPGFHCQPSSWEFAATLSQRPFVLV